MDILADQAMPELISYAAKKLNCKSVAFTYNDPVIFMEYAIDVAKECHKHNIKTVAVTAGYICPKPREEFFQHMDAANVDLKAFTEEFYYKLTGSHLKNILDTLEYIKHKTNTWLEITTLLIPSKNDSPQEIDAMTKWIKDHLGKDVPLHFSAFHPDWKMTDLPPTPPATLVAAREIAMNNGLNYVYTGNIHNIEGDSTYCHNCKELIIKRDWYNILAYNLSDDGKCKKCGTPCAGVFDGPPGNWGSKRQPVYLRDFV